MPEVRPTKLPDAAVEHPVLPCEIVEHIALGTRNEGPIFRGPGILQNSDFKGVHLAVLDAEKKGDHLSLVTRFHGREIAGSSLSGLNPRSCRLRTIESAAAA